MVFLFKMLFILRKKYHAKLMMKMEREIIKLMVLLINSQF